MDRRTIIIGVVALIALIILLLIFFRDGEKDTSILFPTIIPGDITQTQYPFNESTVETYTIEYAAEDADPISAAALSKKIDFTVTWDNGFGFDNVTAMKMQHLVINGANTVEVSNLNLDVAVYGVARKLNNSNILPGVTRTSSILGTNKFNLLYSTDSGTSKKYTQIQSVGTTNFSDVVITFDQLLLSLDLIKRASYIFTPTLKNIQLPSWVSSVTGKFITVYDSPGIFFNLSFGNSTDGIYFIKGTAPDTVQMTIGSDKGIKQLIAVNTDGTLGKITIQTTLQAKDNVKIIQHTTSAGEDSKFSILLADTTLPNHFLTRELTGKFKFSDITKITDDDVYKSIYLKLSDSSADIGMYCKETVSCLTGGVGSCGSVTIGRGQKCIAYSVGDPGGGYTPCSDAQTALVPTGSSKGAYATNCPVNAIYELKNTLDTSCPTDTSCKLPTDPEMSVRSYRLAEPALHGPSPGSAPPAETTPCTYNRNCGDCGYNPTPGRCASSVSELLTHGKSIWTTYPRLTAATAGVKCITPPSDGPAKWEPAPVGSSCPDKAQCTLNSTTTKCSGVDNLYDVTSYTAPTNIHSRPAEDNNCTAPGPRQVADKACVNTENRDCAYLKKLENNFGFKYVDETLGHGEYRAFNCCGSNWTYLGYPQECARYS